MSFPTSRSRCLAASSNSSCNLLRARNPRIPHCSGRGVPLYLMRNRQVSLIATTSSSFGRRPRFSNNLLFAQNSEYYCSLFKTRWVRVYIYIYMSRNCLLLNKFNRYWRIDYSYWMKLKNYIVSKQNFLINRSSYLIFGSGVSSFLKKKKKFERLILFSRAKRKRKTG